MSKSDEDFKPEIKEAECQQDFCDCSHCQEAEEEYHQELEEEYDGFDEMIEAAEYQNRHMMNEHLEEEKARQAEPIYQKRILEDDINECLKKYIELGGIPTNIEMIHVCILNFVSKAMIQFNESNKN